MGAARFEKGVSEGRKPARDAFAGGGSLWVYVNQGENCRWRRRWDSNPRRALTLVGFQDRCIQPLCHSSDAASLACDGGGENLKNALGRQNFVFSTRRGL